MKKIRAYVKEHLKGNLNLGSRRVITGLNQRVRGWLNYYAMPGTTQAWKAADMLRGHLKDSLYRYHRRKSQRYNERFCRNAYYIWRDKGLVDPVSHYRAATPKA